MCLFGNLQLSIPREDGEEIASFLSVAGRCRGAHCRAVVVFEVEDNLSLVERWYDSVGLMSKRAEGVCGCRSVAFQ